MGPAAFSSAIDAGYGIGFSCIHCGTLSCEKGPDCTAYVRAIPFGYRDGAVTITIESVTDTTCPRSITMLG